MHENTINNWDGLGLSMDCIKLHFIGLVKFCKKNVFIIILELVLVKRLPSKARSPPL